jgi:tetratricopeptide (TPR) repeat protein
LPDIARELQVDGVVEGSVMRSGNRVRITAQLIRASTDQHVWSQIYEREFQDIAALQVDIARTIARQAGIGASTVGQTRLDRRRVANRDAFEEYLRGCHAWNKRSPEEIKKAIRHFEKAIDLDAAYAPAYAGLADAYNQLGTHLIGERPPRETRPLAIAAATKAIQREAMEQARNAQELDPLSLIVRTQVGWIHAHQRNFNAAIPIFRDVLERDPNYLWGQWLLGQAYIQTGQLPQAIEVLERAAGHSHRTPAILGTLGAAYARAGRRQDATELFRELTAAGKHKYVSAHAFAWIYLGLGDPDQAFHWLEREFEERSNALAWIGTWHMLDPYRDDPRYLVMSRRIGLSQPN